MEIKVCARGHANVLCLHKTTSEFTAEENLTPRGDCIFAVASDKTMADLPEKFKQRLRSEDAILEVSIECNGVSDTITARGHQELTLTHPTDFVIRKSTFTCPRTLAVSADKASSDLKRELVSELSKGGQVAIKMRLS